MISTEDFNYLINKFIVNWVDEIYKETNSPEDVANAVYNRYKKAGYEVRDYEDKLKKDE